MKPLPIYLLAFLTFWMSTWMVTDIHDLSITDAGQEHPLFFVQHHPPVADLHTADQDQEPHCGVCSYDHGGHMGQTLATVCDQPTCIAAQHSLTTILADFWYSRYTTPNLRPPIA